jgi:hypothetical protein
MLEPDPEILQYERLLREKNLIHNPEVQLWLRVATLGTLAGRPKALERLKSFLQADAVEVMRKPDPFRPYGPASLLSQGNLHLLDQQDGVPWLVLADAPVTGMAVVGAQGGGKTRAIVYLCQQLSGLGKRLFILDPKGELASFADRFGALALDASEIRLDLSPPPGTPYHSWLAEMVPQLGTTVGLIQAIQVLQESGAIASARLEEYRRRVNPAAELCLQDLLVSLDFVPDAYRPRRSGYIEAAKTALGRVLTGSGEMFICRRGVPLEDLFSQNVILDCRHLTDELACRWLAQYILYWKYQEARNRPHVDRLETLVVIDDAQRFLSAHASGSGAISVTTPLSHLLAVLRSSGTGLCASTQLPADVDPGVLALSNLFLVVGGIHGRHHQDALAGIMGLNSEQKIALGKLVQREAVGLYTRGDYRACIHGWVPEVRD